MKKEIKLIAMDLDGTLTQHKTPLSEEHRRFLDRLGEKYKLLMVGAGMCRRIFEQMGRYPIDIIGNYGLQYARFNPETGDIDIIKDEKFICDRASVEARIGMLRERFGFTAFAGDSVEYHSSGCVTFPLLGTKAAQADKLAFDPDRSKRRRIHKDVIEMFPEYVVFVGGSSSFDMAPKPHDKAHALSLYCREQGISHDQVVYIGDDYGPGGNDESVYLSDFVYLTIDDYRDFPKLAERLLNE